MSTLKHFTSNQYRIVENIAYLTLSDNSETAIDISDLSNVISSSRWIRDGKYVSGVFYINNQRRKIGLHRFLMNNPKGLLIDHIDGNPLNNCRINLRLSTNKRNQENRTSVPSNNKSGIRGVTWRKERNRWEAQIQIKNSGHRVRKVRKLVSDLIEAKCVIMRGRRDFYTDTIENRALDLNIMAKLDKSEVNGPGKRFVIWVQGCPHACVGCFNPQSWNFKTNQIQNSLDLALEILEKNPDGLTISGGEPFAQAEALLHFLKFIHSDDGSLNGFPCGIICFTGYTIEEIEQIPFAKSCLQYIDLLIDGRFIESLKYDHGLAGSKNQEFHFSKVTNRGSARIPEEIVTTDQQVEIHFDDPDAIQITGFPTIDRAKLKALGIKLI